MEIGARTAIINIASEIESLSRQLVFAKSIDEARKIVKTMHGITFSTQLALNQLDDGNMTQMLIQADREIKTDKLRVYENEEADR